MANFTRDGLMFLFVVIPLIFSFITIAQGVVKVSKNESGGELQMGFGVALVVLIGISYFLFIR